MSLSLFRLVRFVVFAVVASVSNVFVLFSRVVAVAVVDLFLYASHDGPSSNCFQKKRIDNGKYLIAASSWVIWMQWPILVHQQAGGLTPATLLWEQCCWRWRRHFSTRKRNSRNNNLQTLYSRQFIYSSCQSLCKVGSTMTQISIFELQALSHLYDRIIFFKELSAIPKYTSFLHAKFKYFN